MQLKRLLPDSNATHSDLILSLPNAEFIVPFLTFPGGERLPFVDLDSPEVADSRSLSPVSEPPTPTTAIIHKSIVTPADLFDVLQVKAVLDEDPRIGGVVLNAPYIFGARQDRACAKGQPVTVNQVARLINQAGFEGVSSYVPHSDVLPALINNFKQVFPFGAQVLRAITSRVGDGRHIIVAPDGGATKRTYEVVEYLHNHGLQNVEFVQGHKHRDPVTGKLDGFGCDKPSVGGDAHVWVVDDICAMGGTFLGLAEYLRLPDWMSFDKLMSLNLIVAHADCLDGLRRCSDAYDHVFVSDSRSLDGAFPLSLDYNIHVQSTHYGRALTD